MTVLSRPYEEGVRVDWDNYIGVIFFVLADSPCSMITSECLAHESYVVRPEISDPDGRLVVHSKTSINLTTGAVVNNGAIGGGFAGQISGISVRNVPEPGTLGLLGFGLAMIATFAVPRRRDPTGAAQSA